ncbi:type II secretion system F family protein [Agromyces sp. LHK192]|uniref:type II secretion system F family protein n=1 Tax=Agromyces sp. LHK192 TaxID=2498704 RepID=UPI0013E37E07|nr:type II secretion system F family protein [Agromyces sp. LHK192]
MATTQYAYVGRDATGKTIKGRMDAASESSVIGRMAVMGLSPVSIEEAPPGTGLQREISLGGASTSVPLKDLAIMSRQMATMIGAGLSILRTLSVLESQTDSKTLRAILSKVRDEVESGASVSDSFAAYDRTFPPIMVSMMRAGETGGFLDRALASVADGFEKEVKLRAAIRSALTYPVIVLIMAVFAVVGMLLFIVPIFTDMFDGLGSELPLPTQLLVTLSGAMVWILPVVAVLLLIGLVWWTRNRHTARVRRAVDPWKLRAPVFGKLAKKVAIARFARNLSSMVGAGVPILQSLKIVGETSGNWVIEQSLVRVGEGVRQGRPLSGLLAGEQVFPPMVTQMVAVGEDSGSLEPMLDKVAEFYEQEVETASEQLTATIEPIMIAILGVVIGGMVIALYLPIFTIATAVQGG